MKTVLLFLFLLVVQFISIGQSKVIYYFEKSIDSKIAVLIVLAGIAIYTYIKWYKENKRTDP